MSTTQMNDPRKLFLHELGDVLFAERTLLKALPKLQQEASDDELATGVRRSSGGDSPARQERRGRIPATPRTGEGRKVSRHRGDH